MRDLGREEERGGWGGGRERNEWQVWCSRRRVARSELEPCLCSGLGAGADCGIAGCFVALALLFAVVTKGDACLFFTA